MNRKLIWQFLLLTTSISSPILAQNLSELLPQIYGDSQQPIVQWYDGSDRQTAPVEVARAIYQLNRLPIKLWSEPTNNAPFTSAPELVHIAGHVQGLHELTCHDEWEELLGIRQLWLARIELKDTAGTPSMIDLITSDVPDHWNDSIAIGQPVTCRIATIICRTSDTEKPALAVARDFRWLPDHAMSDVPQDWVNLAAAGIDIGRIAQLRKHISEPLRTDESDLFYALLAIEPNKQSTHFDYQALRGGGTELLGKPADWVGKQLALRLSVRRISRIEVTNTEMAKILGQDFYWQIDAFMEFEKTKIQITASDGKSPPIDFGNRYPVSVISKTLTSGLHQAITSEAGPYAVVAQIHASVVAKGTFFRLWSYASDFMRKNNGGNQTAPLIVAHQISDVEPGGFSASSMFWLRWGWGLPILTVGVVLIFFVWRTYREDRRHQRHRIPSSTGFDRTFLEAIDQEKTE